MVRTEKKKKTTPPTNLNKELNVEENPNVKLNLKVGYRKTGYPS